MKKEVIFNSDLHFEHLHWNRELSFWEDELKSFNNRLEELVNRWTDKEVLKQLEQFQNRFILQKETIDKLQDSIQNHEMVIAKIYEKGEDSLDRILVQKHFNFRLDMDIQRKIYEDLKKEFFNFLSKYM